jgi:hypothetical protein
MGQWILPLLCIISADVSKEQILTIARETKTYIENIEGYKFILIKREVVEGKDTGYQFLDVKVKAEPLSIYIKYLKPKKYVGREVLYFNGEIIARRGGSRMSNMIMHLTPDSPLAMDENKYPITHINPKILAQTLLEQIERELSFDDTTITLRSNAKIYGQLGTYYQLTHQKQQDGMGCATAEIVISNTLKLPIYFKVADFQQRVIEEYAFKDMIVNPEFTKTDFDQNNPEYKLKDREH